MKSPEICIICKGIIPANERNTKRTVCKACGEKKKKEAQREKNTTKESLKKKIARLERHNSFLRECADLDNWSFDFPKVSKRLDIPDSTLYDMAKRFEKGKKAHDFFLKEYADRKNWKPNASKIARKLDIPVSTVWESLRRMKGYNR